MRTFPKSLAAFRKIVDARGRQLRKLTLEELKRHAAEPTEHLTVGSRPAAISTIVQPLPNGGVRVVVQGFLNTRFGPGKHVALDGFYKHPDGSISPLASEEFYEFD
jgi:hypothetical protein